MNANDNTRRRSIRLKQYDYSSHGAYFLTICRAEPQLSFGQVEGTDVRLNPAGLMIVDEWQALEHRFDGIQLDLFVLMPDHLHGILCLDDTGHGHGIHARRDERLPRLVQVFKSLSTKRYREDCSRFGWPPYQARLWQRNYYEHIIRSEQDLDRIRTYILENPAGRSDRLAAELDGWRES